MDKIEFGKTEKDISENIKIELKFETEKWLKRIKERMDHIELLDENRADLIKNASAYISDSEYFLKQGQLIMAFEAIIWSWAYLDIGLRQNWWRFI